MPDDPIDPIDGETTNPVLRRALAQIARAEADMSDIEYINRATDEYWFISLCIEQLHTLPSTVNDLIGCREYNNLRAYSILKSCYQSESMRLMRE